MTVDEALEQAAGWQSEAAVVLAAEVLRLRALLADVEQREDQ